MINHEYGKYKYLRLNDKLYYIDFYCISSVGNFSLVVVVVINIYL